MRTPAGRDPDGGARGPPLDTGQRGGGGREGVRGAAVGVRARCRAGPAGLAVVMLWPVARVRVALRGRVSLLWSAGEGALSPLCPRVARCPRGQERRPGNRQAVVTGDEAQLLPGTSFLPRPPTDAHVPSPGRGRRGWCLPGAELRTGTSNPPKTKAAHGSRDVSPEQRISHGRLPGIEKRGNCDLCSVKKQTKKPFSADTSPESALTLGRRQPPGGCGAWQGPTPRCWPSVTPE